MARIVLVVSGVLEAVWATALGKSEGFSRPGPSIIFAVALIASMAGLAFAAADRNVVRGLGGDRRGVDHGVRDGDGEPISLVRVLLLPGIVSCVAGLKVLH